MQELYKIDWRYLDRSDKPEELTKQQLMITCSEFVPIFNIFGFQASLMVGSKSIN